MASPWSPTPPCTLRSRVFPSEAEAHDGRAARICESMGGRPAIEGEAEHFWRTRHAPGERYLRQVLQSGDVAGARRARSEYRMEYLHVALPVSKVLEYRRRCQELCCAKGAP